MTTIHPQVIDHKPSFWSRPRLFIGACAVVAAGIGGWFVMRPAPTAPDVTFTMIDGKQVSMQDLRGKVVLVKFWATSCVTCVKQMPETISAPF